MKKQNRLKILFLIIMGLMFIFSIFEFIEWLNEPEFKITKEECTNSPIFSYTETDVSNYTKKYNLKKDEVLDDVKILNFLEPEICVESLDEKCGNHLSGTYFFILDNIGEDSEKVYPYYDYYKKEGRIIDANFNEDKTLFTQKFISDYKINLEGISIMKNNGAISFYNANETTSIQVLYTIVKKYYSFKTIEDRKVCEQVEVDEIVFDKYIFIENDFSGDKIYSVDKFCNKIDSGYSCSINLGNLFVNKNGTFDLTNEINFIISLNNADQDILYKISKKDLTIDLLEKNCNLVSGTNTPIKDIGYLVSVCDRNGENCYKSKYKCGDYFVEVLK